eukprot:m51a1_g14798 putative domain containing protein (632) ;mRNA; r:528345-530654
MFGGAARALMRRKLTAASPEDAAADVPPPPAPPPADAEHRHKDHGREQQRVADLKSSLRHVIASLVATADAFDAQKEREFDEAVARAKSDVDGAIEAFFAREREALAAARQRREREAYRQKLVEEILTTEQEYLRDLDVIESVWHAEIERAGVLGQREMQVLFGPLAQLALMSKELAGALAKDRDLPAPEQRIGAAFRRRIPFMKVYIDYCSNQVKGTEIVNTALKNSKFRETVEKIQFGNPQAKNLDLGAFLIKPTQRIMKYPLFLKDLIKYTDESHKDHENLVRSLEAIHAVLDAINARTRERATIVFLAEKLFPSLVWRSRPLDLVASRSMLLKEGKIKLVVTSKEDPEFREKGNWAFVFDNVVLVCKKRDQWQELFSLPTKGMSLFDAGPESVRVANVQMAEEATLYFASRNDEKLWTDSLRTAYKDLKEKRKKRDPSAPEGDGPRLAQLRDEQPGMTASESDLLRGPCGRCEGAGAEGSADGPTRLSEGAKRPSLPANKVDVGLTIAERATVTLEAAEGLQQRPRTAPRQPAQDPEPASALAGASPQIRRVIDQHRRVRSVSAGPPAAAPALPAHPLLLGEDAEAGEDGYGDAAAVPAGGRAALPGRSKSQRKIKQEARIKGDTFI